MSSHHATHYTHTDNHNSTSAVPPAATIELPSGQQLQGHIIEFSDSPIQPDSSDQIISSDSKRSQKAIRPRSNSQLELRYCSHQLNTDISLVELDQAVHAGAPTPSKSLCIYSPAPTPVREYIGVITHNPNIKRRDALIAIGQLWGIKTSYDASFRSVQSAIDQLESSSVPDLTSARERVATAGVDVERLHERVAMLRGRMAVYHESDATADITETEVALKDTIRTLSEASTEEIAAAQRLAQLMDIARSARDQKEKRLSLIDRRQNLTRRIRTAIFDAVKTKFDNTRQTPWITDGIHSNDNHTSALADALAISLLTPLRAPLVIHKHVASTFGGASALAIRLNATVIVGTATT